MSPFSLLKNFMIHTYAGDAINSKNKNSKMQKKTQVESLSLSLKRRRDDGAGEVWNEGDFP